MYRISVGTSWVPQQRRLCLYSIEQKLGLYPGGGAAHPAAHHQLVSRMMTMTSYSGDEGRGARRPPMLVPLRRHPSLPVSEPKRNPLTGFWQHLLVRKINCFSFFLRSLLEYLSISLMENAVIWNCCLPCEMSI